MSESLGDTPAAPRTANARGAIALLLVVLALCWAPVLSDGGAVARAAQMHAHAEDANPYFVSDNLVSLYGWLPLVTLSGFVLILSPGLLLSLLLAECRSISQWLVRSLALSILFLVPFQPLLGPTVTGQTFSSALAGISLVLGLVLLLRTDLVKSEISLASTECVKLIVVAALAYLGVILLLPKMFWENFNGDGAHAFEAARLLLHQPFPFFSADSGEIAGFPGTSTMLFAYPNSWFVRLFGEVEASVRLPFLLYLVGLHAAFAAIAEWANERRATLSEFTLMGLGLVPYALAMAYGATYEPYFADIALPGTQDTLFLFFMLGMIGSAIQQRATWLCLYTLLAHWSLPNGLLLAGLLLIALPFCLPRTSRTRGILVMLAAIVVTLLATQAFTFLLERAGHATPGGEHGLKNLVRRFADLQFHDWQRLVPVATAAGILPAIFAFPLIFSRDGMTRALCLVSVMYLGLFYVQAFGSLHYFAPCMILPAAGFWRWRLSRGALGRWEHPALWSLVFSLFAAIWFSLPPSAKIHTQGRAVGGQVEFQVAGYEECRPEAYRAIDVMDQLYPRSWDKPIDRFECAYLVWNYYACRGECEQPTYRIQPVSAASPQGIEKHAENEVAALYIVDEQQHTKNRLTVPESTIPPVYRIDRRVMFRVVYPGVIEVRKVMERALGK